MNIISWPTFALTSLKFSGCLLAFVAAGCASHSTSTLKEESKFVEWGPKTVNRLARSEANVDFTKLSNHFETQQNGIVCGLASSAIVLNSMFLGQDVKLPEDKVSISKEDGKYISKKYNPFLKKFTQNTVLNEKTKTKTQILGKPMKIHDKTKADYGLQLSQLEELVKSNGTKVTKKVVTDKTTVQSVRDEMVRNLKTKGDYILVNYKRSALGQKGGGHISPIGAYDKQTDSFLIMDVNPNRAPWIWVKAEALVQAMNTFDTVENRGYLLIAPL